MCTMAKNSLKGMRCNYVGIRKMLFKYHKRQLLEAFGWKIISSKDWGIRWRSLIEAGNRGKEKAKRKLKRSGMAGVDSLPRPFVYKLEWIMLKKFVKTSNICVSAPAVFLSVSKIMRMPKQNLSSLCDQCCPSQQASSLSNIVCFNHWSSFVHLESS